LTEVIIYDALIWIWDMDTTWYGQENTENPKNLTFFKACIHVLSFLSLCCHPNLVHKKTFMSSNWK